MDAIVIKGAREHNLKGVSLEIPRQKLVVITGVSGSGKTSLAMDTIFAEGQRRYVESLSAYARQFLAQMPKPRADSIEGLSPSIAIDQKNAARSPRSTVGTVTEINDHLRLLFATVGVPHCPDCGREVLDQSAQEMVDQLLSSPEGRRFSLLAPIARDKKGGLKSELERLRREGFVRVRLDGVTHELGDAVHVDARKKHTLEVFVDRLVVKSKARPRLADSLETALELGQGLVEVCFEDGEEVLFSEQCACPDCGISLPPIEPRLFSFNNPAGACAVCAGLGYEMVFDERFVVVEDHRSIRQGAVVPWSKRGSAQLATLEATAEELGIDLELPWRELPDHVQRIILHGTKEVDPELEGVLPWLDRRLHEFQRRRLDEGTNQDEVFDRVAEEFHRYMDRRTCSACHGARFRRETLAITIDDTNLAQLMAMTVSLALEFIDSLSSRSENDPVSGRLCKEIGGRLGFLSKVGVDYLTLDRNAATLAGGEAQRIRLATQIGSSLVGVLYVLDEPSIGLHQRDIARLLGTLRQLTDAGNTVIVVEHDRDIIETSDIVVDMGPGAGIHGGEVVAMGTPAEVARHERSLTGGYLSGRLEVPVPKQRREAQVGEIVLKGASGHNLRDLDVSLPLGRIICVTGVSGAGKSSLVVDTLLPELRRQLHGSHLQGQPFSSIHGVELLDKVIDVDQAPIGRTPRSNPATYTGVLTTIRELFASLPDAKSRGYGANRFSFNVKGGRCEACQGDGNKRVEMHFLPDIFVVCDLCCGRRYNRETLEVKYKGRDISEVLALTVDEAAEFFEHIPKIQRKLTVLQSVGLGYLALGQSATTLSGGEAQRIKLSKELSRRTTGRTLYVLDEPTTGLHFDDVRRLLEVLNRLVDDGAGNSVIIIEHDLDVIKSADWVIDLGPEGGDEGGRLVAQGPPEVIAANEASHTGRYLKRVLPGKS